MVFVLVMSVWALVFEIPFELRARHKRSKSESRPCSKCGRPTVTRAQMLPCWSAIGQRWRRQFHCYIFNDCVPCETAELRHEYWKSFRWDQELMRKLFGDRRQFDTDKELFHRAGLDYEIQPSWDKSVSFWMRLSLTDTNRQQHLARWDRLCKH